MNPILMPNTQVSTMKQGEASQGGGAAPTAIVFFSLPSASSLNLFHLNPLCHSESTLLLITNLFGLPQQAQYCPHHEDDYSCAALHTTAKISCLEQQRYPKFFTITVWIRHGTGDISGCLRSSNLWAECCTQLPQNGHHHFLEGSGCPLAGSGLLFTKFTNVPTPSQYTVELSVPISLQDTLALLPSSCTHSASTNTVLPRGMNLRYVVAIAMHVLKVESVAFCAQPCIAHSAILVLHPLCTFCGNPSVSAPKCTRPTTFAAFGTQ
mmetsp:Transcript_88376/g.147445  ORF Transcript_88376/g.147445 Transcript_88376/m.147445 type:complete len:266 (-) Transcript_88376:337-1134(-)